jgi:hypothetical protein
LPISRNTAVVHSGCVADSRREKWQVKFGQ